MTSAPSPRLCLYKRGYLLVFATFRGLSPIAKTSVRYRLFQFSANTTTLTTQVVSKPHPIYEKCVSPLFLPHLRFAQLHLLPPQGLAATPVCGPLCPISRNVKRWQASIP